MAAGEGTGKAGRPPPLTWKYSTANSITLSNKMTKAVLYVSIGQRDASANNYTDVG
jgi:hypothetical protein